MAWIAPVVDDLPDRFVVVTVYTFYFQEGEVSCIPVRGDC